MARTGMLGLGLAALALCGAAPVQRAAPAVPAPLKAVEPGQWQLRASDGSVRRLCVANPAMLLQLGHGRTACDHQPIESTANAVTVRYTCAGHGQGRSRVQVETPRLVTVDTSGVVDGTPFNETYEARRIGGC
jgi:hypothetical protein